MKEERIWILMARKLSGEATTDDLDELENLLQANPDIQFTAEALYKLWGYTESENQTGRIDEQKILRRIHKQDISQRIYKGNEEKSYQFLKGNFMIKNYFKVAWRSM